jgi:hypothetical protein
MGAPIGNKNASKGGTRVSGKNYRKAARKAYTVFGMTKSEKRKNMRTFRKIGGTKGKTFKTTTRPYRQSI